MDFFDDVFDIFIDCDADDLADDIDQAAESCDQYYSWLFDC